MRKEKRIAAFNWRRLYLPLFIVPLILCIFLSVGVYLIVRDQLNSTGAITVDKFYIQAESIVTELKNASNSLLINENFKSAVSAPSASTEGTILIQNALRNQIENCRYVSKIYVFSPDQGKAYSSSAVFNIDSWQSMLIQANILVEIHAADSPEDVISEGWNMPENVYGPPCYVSIIRSEDGSPLSFIVVVLNKIFLYRALVSSNSDFCCMYNDNFSVSSLLRTNTDIDYNNPEEIEKLVGEPVALFTKKSENYTYLTAIAKSTFNRPLNWLFISFAAYFLVVIIYSIIHIMRMTKIQRNLFEGVIASLPQPVGNNPSMQTIFSSIKDALNQYREEHRLLVDQSKFRYLDRLVHGRLDFELNDTVIAVMGLDGSCPDYYVARFQIIDNGLQYSEQRNDVLCIILENTLNGFANGRFIATCFCADNNNLCVIFCCKNAESDFIIGTTDHAFTLLEKDYGTTMKCILSSPVHKISAIPDAYTETINLQRFVHLINSDTSTVSACQLNKTPAVFLKGEFLKQLQTLSSTLLICKYNMIPPMVDSLLNEHVTPLRKEYEQAQDRLTCIKTVLLETSFPERFSQEKIQYYQNLIKATDSVSSLSDACHDVFENLAESETQAPPVTRAIEYIHSNISDINLGVPDIAAAAGVSVPHLSRLFRAEMHLTMVEYVNQYRIEYAKSLLADSKYSISEISTMAGYGNSVTFARNFHKYVGCSPSDYQNEARAQKR